MTKKFILVNDGKVIYGTDNYLNIIRKSKKEQGILYEEM